MVQIGSLLFLLLAPMAMGGMLLLATAGREDKESLLAPILAVFLITGLSVSLFSLQSVLSYRNGILGLYLAALAGAFLSSFLYLRSSDLGIIRGWLLGGGILGGIALVLQAMGMPRAHSVNLSPGRLALDLALSAWLLGALGVAVLLQWMRPGYSPLFKRAAAWILTAVAIKTGLSVRYLWELAGLGLLSQGVAFSGWAGLVFWIREISLFGLLIGAAILWYSARDRSVPSSGLILGWMLLAGLLVELFGRVLLIQRGLLL